MSQYCDGKLLVAPPKMRDHRFEKTVVYIWKHDISGASGITINKPLPSLPLSKLCRETGIELGEGIQETIYYGGPVMENCVGCLHTNDIIMKSSNLCTNGDLLFTLDRYVIERIAKGRGPKKFLITMGMAQWGPLQLETELEALPPRKKTESWLVLDYDPNLIWSGQNPNFWNSCLNLAVNQSSREFTNNFFKQN